MWVTVISVTEQLLILLSDPWTYLLYLPELDRPGKRLPTDELSVSVCPET